MVGLSLLNFKGKKKLISGLNSNFFNSKESGPKSTNYERGFIHGLSLS